jgi:hypothetical protein
MHIAQDELRPRHVHSGGNNPTGKPKSPADRVAHHESDGDSERHGDQYPNRDGVAEQLHQGIHNPDLTTNRPSAHHLDTRATGAASPADVGYCNLYSTIM